MVVIQLNHMFVKYVKNNSQERILYKNIILDIKNQKIKLFINVLNVVHHLHLNGIIQNIKKFIIQNIDILFLFFSKNMF